MFLQVLQEGLKAGVMAMLPKTRPTFKGWGFLQNESGLLLTLSPKSKAIVASPPLPQPDLDLQLWAFAGGASLINKSTGLALDVAGNEALARSLDPEASTQRWWFQSTFFVNEASNSVLGLLCSDRLGVSNPSFDDSSQSWSFHPLLEVDEEYDEDVEEDAEEDAEEEANDDDDDDDDDEKAVEKVDGCDDGAPTVTPGGSCSCFKSIKVIGAFTEKNASKYFEKFGTIESIIPPSNDNSRRHAGEPFGFVNFASSDSAQLVAKTPVHTLQDGTKVTVTLSNRRGKRPEKKQEGSTSSTTMLNKDSCSILLSQVPKTATREDIQKAFNGFGSIESVVFQRRNSTAFVKFKSEESAKRASTHETRELASGNVVVIQAKPKKRQPRKSDTKEEKRDRPPQKHIAGPPSCVLRVSGIGHDTSKDDIKKALDAFGAVREIIIQDGSAHVKFGTAGSAAAAASALKSTKFKAIVVQEKSQGRRTQHEQNRGKEKQKKVPTEGNSRKSNAAPSPTPICGDLEQLLDLAKSIDSRLEMIRKQSQVCLPAEMHSEICQIQYKNAIMRAQMAVTFRKVLECVCFTICSSKSLLRNRKGGKPSLNDMIKILLDSSVFNHQLKGPLDALRDFGNRGAHTPPSSGNSEMENLIEVDTLVQYLWQVLNAAKSLLH